MLRTKALQLVILALCCTLVSANTIIPDPSKRKGAGPFFQIRRGDKWGYIDRTGKVVILPQFEAERDFFNGLAGVLTNDGWGFIDEKGTFVIRPQFDEVLDFVEELAPVRLDRKWGYIDKSGRIVIAPQYQAAGEFHEGLARVHLWEKIVCGSGNYTSENAPVYAFRLPDPLFTGCFADGGRFGFIDMAGTFAIEPTFFQAEDFSEGLAVARVEQGRDSKSGYIDRTGTFVIPPRFNQAYSFSEGLARVEVSARLVGNRYVDIAWGFVDKSGDLAIPARYIYASDFSEGLAAVAVGPYGTERWGYIDRTGDTRIPLGFRKAFSFSDGVASGLLNYWRYIDRSGTSILGGVDVGWGFVDGLAIVGKEGRQIYINKEGQKVADYESGTP